MKMKTSKIMVYAVNVIHRSWCFLLKRMRDMQVFQTGSLQLMNHRWFCPLLPYQIISCTPPWIRVHRSILSSIHPFDTVLPSKHSGKKYMATNPTDGSMSHRHQAPGTLAVQPDLPAHHQSQIWKTVMVEIIFFAAAGGTLTLISIVPLAGIYYIVIFCGHHEGG